MENTEGFCSTVLGEKRASYFDLVIEASVLKKNKST